MLLLGSAFGGTSPVYSVQCVDSAGVQLIQFCASDGQGTRYTHRLDVLSDPQETCFSSVATSDDGRIHVVWTNKNRVFYSGTWEAARSLTQGAQVVWLPRIQVSPFSRVAAIDPRIETRGEMIAVTWEYRGAEERAGEGYWRRTGMLIRAALPEWLPPFYVSQRRPVARWR
jgi:hypothetical protein